MTREQLIEQLLSMPKIIAGREEELLQTRTELDAAREALALREHTLLTAVVPDPQGGPGFPLLDGKNEATRKSQLWGLTLEERQAVTRGERSVQERVIAAQWARDQFAALKATARLLGERSE